MNVKEGASIPHGTMALKDLLTTAKDITQWNLAKEALGTTLRPAAPAPVALNSLNLPLIRGVYAPPA